MKLIKIGSMNIRNDKINRHGGLNKNGIDNAKVVGNYINKMQFDFLGTQEMTYYFIKNLEKHLNNEYQILGKFRHSNNIFKKIVPFNESNSIITNQKVISNSTIKLPWLPTKLSDYKLNKLLGITPRIATINITEDNNICFINTHIDYKFKDIQKKQLNHLLILLTNMTKLHNVILTGDFNMEVSDTILANFILELKKLNLKRVEINECTWGKKTLDHMFIPDSWIVKEKGLMEAKDLKETSDHQGIYAKVLIK